MAVREVSGSGGATSFTRWWRHRPWPTFVGIAAVCAVLALRGYSSSDSTESASRWVVPHSAEAVSPSLVAFVDAWNNSLPPSRQSWRIEPPNLDEAGTFEIKISEEVWLSGRLNQSTDKPAEVSVYIAGRIVDGSENRGELPQSHSWGHTHGSNGVEPGHHDGGSTHLAEFDPSLTHDVVISLVRSASAVEIHEAEGIVSDIGLGPEALTAAALSDADGEPTKIRTHGRTFHLQLFPTAIVFHVRAGEPWDFVDSENPTG